MSANPDCTWCGRTFASHGRMLHVTKVPAQQCVVSMTSKLPRTFGLSDGHRRLLIGMYEFECIGKQSLQRGIGQFESFKVVEPKPTEFVVLVGRTVGDFSGPVGDDPDVKRETRSRVKNSEWCIALDTDLNPKLFAELSEHCVCRGFAGIDVTSWDVPDIWIPTSVWMTVAQEYLVRLDQHRCCNEVMAVHPWSLARPFTGRQGLHAAVADVLRSYSAALAAD